MNTKLTTTDDLNKSSMKITATVTEKKTIDKEITLPYYCTIGSVFYCIRGEKDAVKVDTSKSYTNIVKSETWLWASEISEAEECTEADFINALDQVLDSFQTKAA